jgi:hypothetical protein
MIMVGPFLLFGWWKRQKENVREKVAADNLTEAETELEYLKTTVDADRPNDTFEQNQIDHAIAHNQTALEGDSEQRATQSNRTLRIIDNILAGL